LPGGEGAWDTNRVLSSMRMDAAGRLVFGSVGALRGGGIAIHRNWARRRLRALFPQLGAANFEHEWFGTIGMTADCLPRFHELAPNVFAFGGYNGRGIGTGTAMGLWFARLAAGEVARDEMPLPLTPVRAMRGSCLRELVYARGADLVHYAGARF
jgi:glycine/D-amino acid oxidase-like deaminating enzyme